MPNGNTHRLIAALAVGGVSFANEAIHGEATEKPLLSASIAALLTNLPDTLEPAINPHHRQFFHSVLFGGILAYAGAKAYEWQPEDDLETVMRVLVMVGCGAYLVHLLADSTTPRSLPLVGKFL
jgi:membrane-bound metal-dependent hydrolase YbcI (DUF457 family)